MSTFSKILNGALVLTVAMVVVASSAFIDAPKHTKTICVATVSDPPIFPPPPPPPDPRA